MSKEDRLLENRFSYKITKSKVFIYFKNREIMTLKNLDAQECIRILDGASSYEIQYYLATITGNFKHGNEKQKNYHLNKKILSKTQLNLKF